MFNPYVGEPAQCIHPVKGEKRSGLDGILERLGRLDSDDLLILPAGLPFGKGGRPGWHMAAGGCNAVYLML